MRRGPENLPDVRRLATANSAPPILVGISLTTTAPETRFAPATAPSDGYERTILLRAVRKTIRADSDPARQALFANLTNSSPLARLVTRVHAHLGRGMASATLVSSYGFKSILPMTVPSRERLTLIGVALHANARRQVGRVMAWFEKDESEQLIPAGLRASSVIGAFTAMVRGGRTSLRILRIMRTVNARNGFLVSCRVASTISCYVRARDLLQKRPPRAVIVSSDTNPEELGCAAAARSLGIPTLFVSHTLPSPYAPALDFDLSILEGEAALAARQRIGPVRGDVFFGGLEGASAPMDSSRLGRLDTVGLFLPKLVNHEGLAGVVRDCLELHEAKQVLIRWHPSMLEPPRLPDELRALPRVVETRADQPLGALVGRCDLAIADENSNVHLDVLRAGVPSIALESLGVRPIGRNDVYGFCASGVIPRPLKSLRDIHVSELEAFFSGDWVDRFRRFDAAYLRPPEELKASGRTAIHRVIERHEALGSR